MLVRLLELQDPVTKVMRLHPDTFPSQTFLTEDEWGRLQQICTILDTLSNTSGLLKGMNTVYSNSEF